MRTSINRSQKVLDKANKEIAKYDLESKKINDNINKINDEKIHYEWARWIKKN